VGEGETDSERFFALITREVSASGGDVGAGIEAACSWIAANLPLFALNFVLATAQGLWALRYPETHSLYLLERASGAPLEHSSSLGSRVLSDDGVKRPLAVLASERMDKDPRWRLLASGELLHITSTLQVSSRQILEHPPRRLLKLAELGAGARASQAHVANTPSSE
jgi:glutamine amidotransferase